MTLDAEIRRLILQFPLGFVATVAPDGAPRVSPKGTFLVIDDETVAFGAIRSPGTLANLRADPRVEVNFIDPFRRKAARVRGQARIVAKSGAAFQDYLPQWSDAWGDLAARISALVFIAAEHTEIVTTPPYDDGATEDEMIALYKQKFAEVYP